MSTHEPTLRLDGEMTIYQVGERAEELRQALQQCTADAAGAQPSLAIDTSELVEVDSAGLQLLVQFAQSARQAEIALQWFEPGAAFARMIQLYDAMQWFDIPAEAEL